MWDEFGDWRSSVRYHDRLAVRGQPDELAQPGLERPDANLAHCGHVLSNCRHLASSASKYGVRKIPRIGILDPVIARFPRRISHGRHHPGPPRVTRHHNQEMGLPLRRGRPISWLWWRVTRG